MEPGDDISFLGLAAAFAVGGENTRRHIRLPAGAGRQRRGPRGPNSGYGGLVLVDALILLPCGRPIAVRHAGSEWRVLHGLRHRG